ncbi:ABC transporter ATP-binding protein [Clostridium bornimense]|uniref:ABC transporter ATP-binding protein n=1 Tax=Clostridium bornimense TaxID=1216932 RepID=UPI001C1121F7|nr:ABC transporter ATP-binding protein [Clostridium bornimense]MBU5316186.1 ABC transporter ATP-binding protein [Clostridium bornimense]
MIEVKNIEFAYEKNKSFIENLNVNIEEGKVTTILGPNGSGKSTLLGIICGLNKISNGEVWINNKNIKKLSYKDLAKEIATVHQQNSVPEDITVEELVSYGRTPYRKHYRGNDEEDNNIVEWAIEKTGLQGLKNKAVMSMSGGERQRVFIAMALAQKSKVLFLDEPTTYLDIYHQIEILELVKELNEEYNLTVVMVLHDINQAIKYSDNIIVMKKGKVIDCGKSNEVINMKLLNEVYNIGGFIQEHQGEKYFIPLKLTNN